MKILSLLCLVFATAANAQVGQVWQGRNGGIYTVNGGADYYSIPYTGPVAGNWTWTHLPASKFALTFEAKSAILTGGVLTATCADGSTYVVPATGAARCGSPAPIPPPPNSQPPSPPQCAPAPACPQVPPPGTSPPQPAPAPPPLIVPQPLTVATHNVVVVPVRYPPPANTPATAIAYNAYMSTLPKVTQAHLQDVFAPLAKWWSDETFGRSRLTVTVRPAVEVARSYTACDFGGAYNDAGVQAVNGTLLIIVTPYTCGNQGHMVTSGTITWSWATSQDAIGEYAHELGHQLGLSHTARRDPDGSIVIYGGGGDMMQGPSTTLIHWRADHKAMLGALAYAPCVSATLPDIYTAPAALKCGALTIEYPAPYGEVWVSRREYQPYSGGGSDTTLLARLATGQSYSADGYTFRNAGAGQVLVSQ